MSFETIRYELHDGIAQITLARPAVMNALNTQMRTEITDAMTQAAREARVAVLTGEGRAFCSGQDLADGVRQGGLDFERTLRDEYEPMLKSIYDCPIPTICAVNGPAAGAGANLALAADVVIAAQSASFVQAFTRIGLMPDAGGTYWLPRQIGFSRAMGLALFADKIMADQAAEWGMIWESLPDDAFEAGWKARAAHLANGPSVAYGAIKEALRGSFERDLPQQLELEAKLQAKCGATEDFMEGVTAFLQKRPAAFKGK
ncbi:enoyl-CoA hydratase-related protein [Albirhodobacter sp. R86504]|jgi:2-(1,2-epoxy-1,2-dihydrophenyl)acetyl-CoA isomerase|uniref:enoyl-CoA hydratase-related protein n=1 Tax=Albirhodobacter sp. R86504 TaxID=3093848 RepID=UPI00366DDB2D